MSLSYSPLRYPGGKTSIFEVVSGFIKINKLQRRHYAEPYAGGCGLALALLYDGLVSDIHINDIDHGVWAFWDSVLNDTENLAEMIIQTPVTIDEREKQRELLTNNKTASALEIGFATFFLNRTNRSGIIKNAGVIGGRNQKGKYKLDCRFNKDNLLLRIRRIAKYRNRIHLDNQDAVDFMAQCEENLPEELFFCIDPPYFNKGSSLYANYYKKEDHKSLAKTILSLKRPWILTYDDTEEIKKLYSSRRQFQLNLNYSANVKRVGTEILVASKGLYIPASFKSNQSHRPQYRAA
jgi:DNA adenine methylase